MNLGRAFLGLICLCLGLFAQTEDRFKTRLYPVPVDATTRSSITGAGNATAVLSGTKLTVTGTFEGLQGPATAAHIHRGIATGVKGPVVADLMVTRAASGTVSGTVNLTAEQIEDLKKGRLYIQIHSEKAPDGNLWGFLLH